MLHKNFIGEVCNGVKSTFFSVALGAVASFHSKMRLGKRKWIKSKEIDLTLNCFKDLGNRKVPSRVSGTERVCQAYVWISTVHLAEVLLLL